MRKIIVLVVALSFVFAACKKAEETTNFDSDSTAQQIGDAMNSIDDTGGSDGGYAMMAHEAKVFARLAPAKVSPLSIVIPRAAAVNCSSATTFGSCTNNVVTRTFSSCNIGSATVTGTVTFTFDDGTTDGTCTNDSNGDTITRNPSFTITGARGGTFTVSKTGVNGQRISRTSAGVFAYSNDGIRRVLAYNGTTLGDYTTSTTSNITVSGATRSGRVANGGTLHVVNNRTGETCDFSPSNVTWSSGCTCATSGSWSATCSSSGSSSFTITSCGVGTLVEGSTSSTVYLDQCF